MDKWMIDVPVLLLFFTRPEHTKKVFEAIRAAKPSKLYLYQDGPRLGRTDDIENIERCRKVVENIDWECKVYRNYQGKNYGCDPSEYLAQKWMFETEEYGIILEDDDVPSQSFFPYCKELLEKYKDDENIQMVCGYNPIDEYMPCKDDYFFSKVGSIWGWATWKRVVDTWDPKYSWMDDPDKQKKYFSSYPTIIERNFLKKVLKRHRASGIEHYETINSSNMMLYDRLAINPKYNMISNIGIGGETTHSTNDIRVLPHATRRLLYKNVHEYTFPLKHPQEIVCCKDFKHQVDKVLGHTIPTYLFNKCSHYVLVLRYKGIKGVKEAVIRKKNKRRAVNK